MLIPTLSAEASLVITIVLGATAFVIGVLVVPRIKTHKAIQVTLRYVMAGPVLAAIVGYGLLESFFLAGGTAAVTLPSFLQAPELWVTYELIVLAVSLRAAGEIVKAVIPPLIKAPMVDRVLVYSIYALGFFLLSYVILSSPISPRVATNVWAFINFMTGLFVTYLGVYIANMVFRRYAAAIESREIGLRTTLTFVRRLILSILALIGVAAATFNSFPTLGAAIASVFVAAGFASIVIGLAAQASLSNLIAGIVISTSQPFRLGDALSYAGEWAWVEDIKLTFTVLRTWDNRRLVVPNQNFLSTTMINYDAVDSSKLCIVYVTITYESDLDKAIEILKNAAKNHPDFLPTSGLPVVHVMDLGDANGTSSNADIAPGITLRLLGRAKDQPTNFQMSKDILYTVKKEFDSNGIEIAYPRRQVVIDPQPRRTAKKTGNTQESIRSKENEGGGITS